MARAMGLAWDDHPGIGGPYLYRIVDGGGENLRGIPSRRSRPRNAARPPPPELKADPTPEGVRLDWGKVKPGKDVPIPVLAFRVKRDDGKGFMALGKVLYWGPATSSAKRKTCPATLTPRRPKDEKSVTPSWALTSSAVRPRRPRRWLCPSPTSPRPTRRLD